MRGVYKFLGFPSNLLLLCSFFTIASSSISAAETPGITLKYAVQTAVKNSPQIVIQSIGVDIARAEEQNAGAPFDAMLTSSAALQRVRGYELPDDLQEFGENPNVKVVDFMTEKKNNTELKTGLTKLYRSGLYTDFSVSLQSTKDFVQNQELTWNVFPNLTALNPAGSGDIDDYSPAYPSVVRALLNIPLLKMRGQYNLPAANETSKRLTREASEATLKHAIAKIIQNVVDRYWDYNAAQARLKYTINSRDQVTAWISSLSNTKGSKEMAHLRGFKTQLDVEVTKTEGAHTAALNALAKAMGISVAEAGQLGEAIDRYPLDWSQVLKTLDDKAVEKRWSELATKNRHDLKAANLKLEAAKAIHRGAKNDKRAKLDLALILEQHGLNAGGDGLGARFDSLSEGTSDLGYTALLSYAYPLGNSKAKSLVTKTKYGEMQAHVQNQNAHRTVGLAINTATSNFRASLEGLAAALKQTEHYVDAQKALTRQGKIKKSEIFDLVAMETSRLNANLNHIGALQSVANSLTAAHFETGTLIVNANNLMEISIQDLASLPK